MKRQIWMSCCTTLVLPAGPTAVGTFDNPRTAGVCAVDPDGDVAESNETNNSCVDSVQALPVAIFADGFEN